MNAILSLVLKDVSIELRRKESVAAMVMFGFLVLVIFNFAIESANLDPSLRPDLAPGVLWVAVSLAAILGLNRSLAIDLDNDSIQGLLLAPLARGTLYVAKVLSNFLFILIADCIALTAVVIFHDLDPDVRLLWVALIVVLGTFGFASVGTILAMVSSHTRMSEVMLPVLLIPLTLPLILASLVATATALSEQGNVPNMNLIIGFDIIFLVISYLVFDYVVDE
jgi:heme exporter protein B